MRIVLDTSALIAGFVDSHPKHREAILLLQKLKTKKIKFAVSAHTVAECFAVLTRLPLSPKITPDNARFMIRENIEKSAEIIPLTAREYLSVIKDLSELSLSGGIIYDALTLKAAIKHKADNLITLNEKDFLRIYQKDDGFIQSIATV